MNKVSSARVLIGKEAGLLCPSSLVSAAGGKRLYIVDMGNKRILGADLTSKMVEEAGKPWPPFRTPLAAAMMRGNLLVTDAEANFIWAWNGNRWRRIPFADTPLPVRLPGSVAGGDVGWIYFTDFHNNRICRTDMMGNFTVLTQIRCEQPYGLCLWKDWLYVTDTGNGAILRYHIPTNRCSLRYQGEKGKFHPLSLAADAEGGLYIGTNRRIFRLEAGGEEPVVLVDAGIWQTFGLHKLGHIGALAPLPGGNLLFSDTVKNCIYHLRLQRREER